MHKYAKRFNNIILLLFFLVHPVIRNGDDICLDIKSPDLKSQACPPNMLPSTSSVDTNVTISGLHVKLENVKEEADIETKDDDVDDTAKHSDVDNDQVDNIVDEIKVEIKDEEVMPTLGFR